MKHIFVVAVAGAATTAILALGSRQLAADESACTAGNGRYQVSTVIYNEFKTKIYETVVDTCSGQVVRREEIGAGEYK